MIDQFLGELMGVSSGPVGLDSDFSHGQVGRTQQRGEHYRAMIRADIESCVHYDGVVGLIGWINECTAIVGAHNAPFQDQDILIEEIRRYLDEHYPYARSRFSRWWRP